MTVKLKSSKKRRGSWELGCGEVCSECARRQCETVRVWHNTRTLKSNQPAPQKTNKCHLARHDGTGLKSQYSKHWRKEIGRLKPSLATWDPVSKTKKVSHPSRRLFLGLLWVVQILNQPVEGWTWASDHPPRLWRQDKTSTQQRNAAFIRFPWMLIQWRGCWPEKAFLSLCR